MFLFLFVPVVVLVVLVIVVVWSQALSILDFPHAGRFSPAHSFPLHPHPRRSFTKVIMKPSTRSLLCSLALLCCSSTAGVSANVLSPRFGPNAHRQMAPRLAGGAVGAGDVVTTVYMLAPVGPARKMYTPEWELTGRLGSCSDLRRAEHFICYL